MDDIYYLIHTTNTDPKKFKELRKKPSCKDADKDQFPGVFFTLVTQYNIDTEMYYPGKYVMIFSKELLKQKNYHINSIDCNGMVTEKYTFYPWNLDSAVKEIEKDSKGKSDVIIKQSKNRTMNEVVFHDAISMKYCCKIIEKPSLEKLGADNYFKFIEKGGVRSLLPRKSLKNSEPANLSKLPFYCYNMEDLFTGGKIHKSSLRWFKMMLKVANIEEDVNTVQKCINLLRKKAPYLCDHRNEQNIDVLKNYTLKLNKTKRNTKRNKTNNTKTRKQRGGSAAIDVFYGDKKVQGNEFTSEETSLQPTVKIPEGYTLVMYDPDAVKPSWIHWISSSDGDIVPYKGPSPPPGTGIHHYKFAVVAGNVPDNFATNQNRGRKDVSDLLKSAVKVAEFVVKAPQ
jgi:hypothetical protein